MALRWCVLLLSLLCPCARAQDIHRLPDLSTSEFDALERASEASVTGTISFLASDELAGRGTPSTELTIATAYVASRLRAAGAEGLGPDDSYFIESKIETIQTAAHGCKLTAPLGEVRVSPIEGMPAGDDSSPYEFIGTVAKRSADKELPDNYSGPTIIKLGDSEGDGPPISFQLQRVARQMAASGSSALLVEADPDSPLWDLAANRQNNPRIDSARGRFGIPVVVIAEGSIETDQEISLVIPQDMNKSAIVRNVIGVLRGSDSELAAEAVLFTAHLDHLGDGAPGEDRIYNGADDDASGVTAVLTLADAFGALNPKPKRSLIFMTFWGEERGLLGSKEFVKTPAWPLDKIVANINIEMIGRPEEGALNKCWMTGWTESNLGELIAQGSRRLGVETFEHPSYSSRLYRASDNFSFVQKGVIAHSFSAGSLHSDYHQPSDEWHKLNLPHMTQVIRGLYAGALPIANGELTPQARK